jgi:hypothetical protein
VSRKSEEEKERCSFKGRPQRVGRAKPSSLRIALACEQPVVRVEISEKATKLEVDWWRLAHSKSATEKETAEAAVMFFRSVRQRNSRYLVRQLGSPKQSQDYNAGI